MDDEERRDYEEHSFVIAKKIMQLIMDGYNEDQIKRHLYDYDSPSWLGELIHQLCNTRR